MNQASTCKPVVNMTKNLPPSIDQIIAAVLSKSHYKGGNNLPMANEENRKLQEQLERKQSQLLSISQEKEDDILHITSLENHIERTKYAVLSSQNLISAKTRQLAGETESCFQAERTLVRTRVGLHKTREELSEMQGKSGKLLEYNKKRKEAIDASMTRWYLSAERLKELVQLTQVRAADIQAVTEDSHDDHQHLKRMTTKSGALDRKHRLLLSQLDTENANTLAHRDLLSRLTEDFRENHKQRKDIIQMWEETVSQVKRRDTQMTSLAQEYHHLRTLLQPLTERIDQALGEQALTVASTKEAYFEIEQIERKINQVRDISLDMKEGTEILQGDVSQTRNDCNGLKQRLSITSTAITAAQNRLYDINKELTVLEPAIRSLKADLEERMLEFGDSERNVEAAQNLIKKLETQCEKLIEQIAAWDNLRREKLGEKYLLEQEVNMIENQMRTLQSELQGIRSTFTKEEDVHRNLTELVRRITMRIWNLNVRIIQMTDISGPDFKLLKETVSPLRGALAEAKEDNHLIARQIGQNSNRLFTTEYEIRDCVKARQELDLQMKYIRTTIDRLEKSIERVSEENNDNIVEINLKQVMLKRIQNKINVAEMGVCEIEQNRLEMEGAVKERKAEIETLMVLNKSILRSELGNMQKIKGFIQQVQNSILHKKLRYDRISRLLQITPEDSTSGHNLGAFTEAFLKAMSEQEMLRKVMHDWENKLKEGEIELEGLRNAASVVAISNQQFKQSLYPASTNSSEYKAQVDEESETNSLYLRKHEAKKQCQGLLAQIHRWLHSMKAVRYEIVVINSLREGKQETVTQLSEDIVKQDEVLHQLNSTSLALLADVKSSTRKETLQLLELELKNIFLHEKLQVLNVPSYPFLMRNAMISRMTERGQHGKFALVMLAKVIQNTPTVKNIIFSHLGAEKLVMKLQDLLQNGFHKLQYRKRFLFLQELYPQFIEYVADDKQWRRTSVENETFTDFKKAMKHAQPFFKIKHRNQARFKEI